MGAAYRRQSAGLYVAQLSSHPPLAAAQLLMSDGAESSAADTQQETSYGVSAAPPSAVRHQ